MGRAFTILLLAPLLSGQVIQQPGAASTRPPGSVAGRITDAVSGNAIAGASVHLFPRGGGQTASITSLEDGSFHFDSVVPGTYVLLAEQPSYQMSFNRSETLTVNDGQQVNSIAMQMNPLGTMSGKVLTEGGRPLAGINVELFSAFYQRGTLQLRRVQNTSSNLKGEFSIQHVAPGKYYLTGGAPAEPSRRRSRSDDEKVAKAPSPIRNADGTELNYVRTYYPKAATLESASLIEVAPGASNADLDLQLKRAETFHVRGKVEGMQAGALQHIPMLALAPRGTSAFGGLGRTFAAHEDGSFAIDKVQSGSYTLYLLGSYAGGVEPSRRASRSRLLGKQDVDVNGSDVSGLALSLLPAVNLTGRVIQVNGTSGSPGQAQQLRVILQPAGQAAVGSFSNAVADASGAFAFQDLEPGEYMVRVLGVPVGMYVHSVTLNRQDVMTSGMDLLQGGGGELQITLRGGAAEVDGSLSSSGGGSQGVTGTVLLIPETIPVDGSGVLLGSLATGGTFAVKSVPPGHYSAFAIEHWTTIWQNPDFLRSMQRDGTPVDVQENGHAQVQLPFLTMDQVQADASRVGLSAQ